jgi:hypothetical protein
MKLENLTVCWYKDEKPEAVNPLLESYSIQILLLTNNPHII